jgi:probable 2-oxoglutarate dehydrogenase E1 component DHKTD1
VHRVAPELDPTLFGIDLRATSLFSFIGLIHSSKLTEGTTADLVNYLESVYCGPSAIEAKHINDEEEKQWLFTAFEKSNEDFLMFEDEKKQLARDLIRSQVFDQFLAKKFGHIKRYGAEGAESLLGFMGHLFHLAATAGVKDIVIGMPHRGRLNFLVDLLKFHPSALFHKMKGNTLVPGGSKGSGDVLSHLVNSVDLPFGDQTVHVTLVPNPSHLEAVCPVALGKARGREMSLGAGDYSLDSRQWSGDKVLCVQVHGDASFTAQGIVTETLTLSQVPHFRVGGSIHVLVNNQLGFTTPSDRGRSSLYASDVGKMINCPVFRVNGDHPEEVIRICRLAMEYRMKYKRDVVVDLICFRRWGHNEMDDPSLTQPLMYKIIESRDSVPDLYVKSLINSGTVSQKFADTESESFNNELSVHLSAANDFTPKAVHLQKQWHGLQEPSTVHVTVWNTGTEQW